MNAKDVPPSTPLTERVVEFVLDGTAPKGKIAWPTDT